MARPLKSGLDYFNLDVDVFEDEKLLDLQNNYGPLGEVILLRLLCLIYRNGYYYRFESMDKLCALLIKSIGNRWVRDKNTVKKVILSIAESNLLSAELMRENVLTSRGIQKRFLKATERRQCNIELKYWLLEKNDFSDGVVSAPDSGVIADNNSVNVYNNPINVCNSAQSKVKENKVNYYNKTRTREKESGGSFDTDEFFEAAVRKALGEDT